MPSDKNAYMRYKVLDECFRDWRRRYTWKRLLAAVNSELDRHSYTQVSVSTIRADVEFLKSEEGGGIPLETLRDGHEVYMRYSDPDFSILQQEITPREMQQLTETVEMLSRFKGLPNYEWLNQTLTELKVRFGLEGTAKDSVAFAHNDNLVGLRWFEPLFQDINGKRLVSVKYHRFGKPERQRVIHPYQLRQYNYRWYLVGREDRLRERHRLVVLPIDRMSDVKTLDDVEFRPESAYQIERHFNNNVGVSVLPEGKVEVVRVKAWSYAADYMETKPIHFSQRVIDENDNVNENGEAYKIFEWRQILFIDDEPLPILIKTLKKTGWKNIKRIGDIANLDAPDIRNANIIFVDIKGVGKELMFKNEGVGLAAALKQKYPKKGVVIYSATAEHNLFDQDIDKVDGRLFKNAEPIQFSDMIEQYGKPKD